MAELRAGECEDQLRRMKMAADEQNRQLQDANALKTRLGQENYELHRHLQELDTNNASLTKTKTALQQDLDETKTRLDEETRVIVSHCSALTLQSVVMLLCISSALHHYQQ